MLQQIQRDIRKHTMFAKGEQVLVGVSGGADSIALLHALHALSGKLEIKLTVAHLDHGIRGKAAREDTAFVKALAGKLKVSFIAGKSNVPARARRKGISIEMAAREARYAFFKRMAKKTGATVLATAHSRDDQAETVLLKLLRGAGTRGLGGMAPVTGLAGIRLARPLLEVSREEIVGYLRRARQTWREDESNSDTSYLRNRVRHELLPFLEERFNPRVRETLFRTADILREEAGSLDAMAREALEKSRDNEDGLDVSTCKTLALAPRRLVFRLWLSSAGVPVEAIDFDTIERINKLVVGRKGTGSLQLGGGLIVERRYERLVLGAEQNKTSESEVSFHARLAVPGESIFPEEGLRVVTSFSAGIVREKTLRPGILPARASIKWPRRKKALDIRFFRAGDNMRPFGMKGSKKLQDIFVDAKVPVAERQNVPLVTSGSEIVWIPGYRIGADWAVTDPDETALQISVERI